ncbi:dihydrodipicolinate synthase family protein [Vibrio nigripulchritudo]|uniref:dihydrodipicolinate synthase family protein n=1 Tax=Vibrio nigripulchritudo TaxID=28173 RepID=UPI0003B1CC82|nr:dihydrodipicolinate synthase family protein [Vibrio nigripulchritudo]CCN71453.1 putative Aldolase [Vibrio nigripulchritudo SFn118]
MTHIILPDEQQKLSKYQVIGNTLDESAIHSGVFNRIAFSAAHVVANPLTSTEPSGRASLDWEKTLAYRHYLMSMGFGIAEAMDTAQRGMGLTWDDALALIRHTQEAVSDMPDALIYHGCGTDQLDDNQRYSLDEVIAAYREQIDAIQSVGGKLILMASRALAKTAKSEQDYFKVYQSVLKDADNPVILHWLGDMFDPQLTGYWGTADVDKAMDTVVHLIHENQDKIDGIKISLLDAEKEIQLRKRLPAGVKMYTGDDFNYPELIAGDSTHYSHALLGIFDAIAPAAALALTELGKGNQSAFMNVLEPTVPLSRLIFSAPTRFYKTGVVFLAYLNGFQDHFVMVGGAQSMRPITYFTELFKMADQASLLRDPDFAADRMKRFLKIYGVTN